MSAVGPANTSSGDMSTSFEAPTIKRMIDRFRHASPMSREERSFIDANAKPDFWWTKLGPGGTASANASFATHPNASYNGGATGRMDPRNGVASFLSDTAPGSYTYRGGLSNVLSSNSGRNTAVAPSAPENDLSLLTAKLFAQNVPVDSANTGPSSWMPLAQEAGRHVRAGPTAGAAHLPASAAIVAEDLDQALAGFRRRYSVEREKVSQPRYDEYGYEIDEEEEEQESGGHRAGAQDSNASFAGRGRAVTRQPGVESGAASRSRSASANGGRFGSSRPSQVAMSGGARGSLGEAGLGGEGEGGEDVPGQRAALARAQALTGALRGMGMARPPSGRTSLNVSSSSEHGGGGGGDGLHTGAGPAHGAAGVGAMGGSGITKEEARRRRLSNALSSLAEGLDVSMLTLSRKLASMSGDAGSLVETGAAILASAAEAGRARDEEDGAMVQHARASASMFASPRDTLPPVVTELPMYAGGAAGALLSSPDRRSALSRAVGSPSRLPVSPPSRSPVRVSRGAGPIGGSVSPLSPRQQQVQADWRSTWKVEAGEQAEGTENVPQPLSTPAVADPGPPTPSMPGTTSGGVRRQPSALELLEAAMRGDAAAFVSALEGKPAPAVESSETAYSEAHEVNTGGGSSRASRMQLSLEPAGKLSTALMKSLSARRMSGASTQLQAAAAAPAPTAPAAPVPPAGGLVGTTEQLPPAASAPGQAAGSDASAAVTTDPSPAASTAVGAAPAGGATPAAHPPVEGGDGVVESPVASLPAVSSASAPPQPVSDDFSRLTVTNAAGVSTSLGASQLLGSGGGVLNTSLTAPGSSFIPLTAFIPPPAKPRAVLGADGNPLLLSSASEPHLSSARDRDGFNPALHAAFSLPSVWGRPPAPPAAHVDEDGQPSSDSTGPLLPGVDLSALQAQALEATLGFGAAVPPVMHPYTGVTPGRAGMGYTYQAPPPQQQQPNAASAGPRPPTTGTSAALPAGSMAIPAELAPVFAAFLEEHVAKHGYVSLGGTRGPQSPPRQEQAPAPAVLGMSGRPAQPPTMSMLSPVSPPSAPSAGGMHGGDTAGRGATLPRAGSFPLPASYPAPSAYPQGGLVSTSARGGPASSSSMTSMAAVHAHPLPPPGPEEGAALPLHHHWPPALPEYSGSVPLWPEGGYGGVEAGYRAGSFDSLPPPLPFPHTGWLLHGEYGGTPPAAPGDLTGAWPTAGLPAHVSLSSGLPTGSRPPLPLPMAVMPAPPPPPSAHHHHHQYRGSAAQRSQEDTSTAAEPVTSAPSGVARQVESLLSTHEELTRRATAVLGMGPEEISRAQAQRVSLINAQAHAEAQLADARKRAFATPSSYDAAPMPSSLTVEAQVTFKRAQAALDASARLRAMLAGSQGPPSQATSPATMGSRGYVSDAAGDVARGGPGAGQEEGSSSGGAEAEEGGEDYVDLSGYRG